MIKFVLNHKDQTLRCIYDDKIMGFIRNVGEVISIKRISDIEPNLNGSWTITYRAGCIIEDNTTFPATRERVIRIEHDVVQSSILETKECKDYLGKTNENISTKSDGRFDNERYKRRDSLQTTT